MDRLFQTSRGPIRLIGDPEAFLGVKPVLLAISGAFAPADAFDRLAGAVPSFDVLLAHLPGNHSPLLIDHEISTYAAAFSEVVGCLKRPTLVCGSSLGGTVALAMDAPNLCKVIALDPPLDTMSCDPLIQPFRSRLGGANNALQGFLWTVFGLSQDSREQRCYLPLVSNRAALAIVITGDGRSSFPSLLGQAERDALKSLPRVKLISSSIAGHNVVYEDPALVLREIRRPLTNVCEDQDDLATATKRDARIAAGAAPRR